MDHDKFDFGDRQVDKRYPGHINPMKRGLIHVGVPIGPQSFVECYAEEFFEKKENLVKVLPPGTAVSARRSTGSHYASTKSILLLPD